MANPSTLYRFKLEVSDVERGFYDAIDFRAAMHPSETEDYLLTRVLAYALNFQSGLEFTPGLCVGDEPALFVRDAMNPASSRYSLSIEIGNPSARRLHKASKSADRVRVYTYKDVELLKREAQSESVHRASEIEIFALEPRFLAELGRHLQRDNSWGVIHNDGEITVTIGSESFPGALHRHSLSG